MNKPLDTDEIRSEVAFAPDKDGRFFDIIHELCHEVDRQRAKIAEMKRKIHKLSESMT